MSELEEKMSFKSTKSSQMSMAYYDVERRTSKNKFFKQIDSIIDWNPIEKQLKKIYRSGKKERGQKAYNPLILFKMQLVSMWYDLSDVHTEETCNDNLSVMKFCGLALEDSVPDHSTLSRFRTELTQKKAYDRLLKKINRQLDRHNLIVKQGIKVDASLTQSPFSPKGKPTYEIAEDRKEDQREHQEEDQEQNYHEIKKVEQPGADNQARWLKKSGKNTYGYKKHIGTEDHGLILGVHTTTANEHDSKGLEGLIDKIPNSYRKQVMADKGYASKSNNDMLKEKGSKSRLMYKAYRNNPLTNWQRIYNKIISKTRWVVKRTFGSIKRWFGGGKTRLKSLYKVHSIHVLEAIAYNLKRSPGLVALVAKNHIK